MGANVEPSAITHPYVAMPEYLRRNAWRLGSALLVVAGVSAAFLVLRNSTSEAFPGMPPAERSYWEWVRSINEDPSTALESGFALLAEHPELHRLYGRLADVCVELERADACRSSLKSVEVTDASTALYRDAALAQLGEDSDESWARIAASLLLDPALARIVVDRARRGAESPLLGEIEASWSEALAADSSRAGAAFGLGYAAVLRNDWASAGPLLTHAAELRPNDPNAFAEFGRMYFFTGDYESFVASMERAIENSKKTYDVERQVALQGNLGLGFLQWKGDLEKAGEMFETALEQGKILSMGRTQAINLNRLANVRARQHRYDDALVLVDSAHAGYAEHVPHRINEVLALKGLILKSTFQYTEAEHVLEEALSTARDNEDLPGIADGLLAISQVRHSMGRYPEAYAAALDALELVLEYGISDKIMAAREVLGRIERQTGNYQAAKEHLTAGLAVARASKNNAREEALVKELGITALQIGDLGAAHSYFEHLLTFTDDRDRSVARAEALYWMGNSYLFYGNHDGAISAYQSARDLLGDASRPLLGVIHRNHAAALYFQGRHGEALHLLQESKPLLAADDLQYYAVVAATGHTELARGEFDEALEHFEEAERIEDELQWSAIHWYVSYGKAMAYWRLERHRRAEEAFLDAISVIETLRDHLDDPEDRSFFVHDKIKVYDSFSAFLETQGRTAEAFHYNERARSRTLVDLLYTTQQSRRLSLADPVDRAVEMNRRVRAVERELVDELVAVNQGEDEGDVYRENRAAYLRRERLRADSLYRNLQLEIFGSRRLFTFDPIEADSAFSILREDEAIIVYNLIDDPERSDGLYPVAYVLSKTGITSHRLDIDVSEVAESIKFFRDAITNPAKRNGGSWRSPSRKLYSDLFEAVVAALPPNTAHLSIVPEGAMHYLPISALLDENDQFLIESYTLSIAPSVSILKLCRDRNPRRWRSMLLLADPDNRLPGARREVLSIVADSPSRRHALIGSDASQEMFEKVAPNYDIIHFATHGSFNSLVPWNSHLELYDDALTVDEIGKLSLDAYLVTLSACETALSSGLVADIPNGDEWVGLNQAFLAAGTPTVMASLWPIDDRVSSTFMTQFYKGLGSEGKAAALSDVQRSFALHAETRHPFYWAAFSIIGDPL